MKILIECTEKEITAIQDILHSGKTVAKELKKIASQQSFNIKSTKTISNLLKELKIQNSSISNDEDLMPKETQETSECFED